MQGVVKPRQSQVTQYATPSWIRDTDPDFLKIIDYYYQWMGQTNMPYDILQNLVEYRDIRQTSTYFANIIFNELLPFIPTSSTIDRELLALFITDFYKAKGTFPSYNFIMETLFNDSTTSLTWNKEKVFRPSSNALVNDAYLMIQSNTAWGSYAIGSIITQTFPTTATATIELCTTQIVNGKTINQLQLDPKSVSGVFSSYGTVQVLNNQINRSFTYISEYYTAVSFTSTTATVTVYSEPVRNYTNLILMQIGSNFSATIISLASRVISNGQTVLTFNIVNSIGTAGTGDVYLVEAAIQNEIYTKSDFLTGIVSPSITNISVSNGGSLLSLGDQIEVVGGSGSPFVAHVSEISGGAIDTVNIINPGYGYSIGDSLTVVSTNNYGSGLAVDVESIDGINGQLEAILELDNFNIVNGGSQYNIGDIITINDGVTSYDKSPTILTVSSINSTLALNSLSISNGGYGYQYVQLALLDTTSNSLVSGFTATANIQNGSITSATITQYPTLTHNTIQTLVNGYGATISFTVTSGVITGVSVTGGFNYVNPQIIINSVLTPTTPAQFAITTNPSGTITSVVILNGGAGYSSTVTGYFQELYGSNANITPIINSTTGPITGLTITNRGAYTSLPSCFNTSYLSDSLTGIGLILDLKFRLNTVKLLNGGNNYKIPSFNISDGIGSGAVFNPNIENGVVSSIGVTTAGSGYTYAIVEISSITGKGFSGTVNLSGGTINSVTINNGGFGYLNTDVISVIGDGINGVLHFSVSNGVISDISVISGGSNYAYDAVFNYVMDPILNPSAVAATFKTNIIDGVITSVKVLTNGSGYVAGVTNDLQNEDGTYLLLEDGLTKLSFDSLYDVPYVSGPISANVNIQFAPTGSIVSASVINAGSGYYDPTEVTPLYLKFNTASLKPPVIAPVLQNGSLCRCDILYAGEGLSTSDTISVIGNGINASLMPTVYNGHLASVEILNGGSGYKYGTSCLVYGNSGGAQLQVNVDRSISYVEILNGGSNYTNPIINITDATGSGAVLHAIINSSGVIINVQIISGGSNYTNPTLSVVDAHTPSNGINASLSAKMLRNISSVDVILTGQNYSQEMQTFIVGDGINGQVSVQVERYGSLYYPTISNIGSGYIKAPTLNITDISNYGGVSAVKIINEGTGYTELPILSLATKYSGNTVIASGASFNCYGQNVGSINEITFDSFGADWYDLPKIHTPFTAILDTNADFRIGETVSIERAAYQPIILSTDTFGILTEDGSYLDAEFVDSLMSTEDGFTLTTEDGYEIDNETIAYLYIEYYSVTDLNGNVYPYYDAGPIATVSNVDFGRNFIELKDATDDLVIIAENGDTVISENGLSIVDQTSNPFKFGDSIIGNISNSKSTIKWFNRPTLIANDSDVGYTAGTLLNSKGVISSNASFIQDSYRIQDFAYEINSNTQYSSYKAILEKTVHPAGYNMLGNIGLHNYGTGSVPVSVPAIYNKTGGSAVSTLLGITGDFVDATSLHYKTLWFWESTMPYFYDTAAEYLINYTFAQFDPAVAPTVITPMLTYYDAYESKILTTSAAATAASGLFTGTVSTAIINIGYRVIGYDSNGANIFIENHLLNEDTTNLLTEAGDIIDTDELMVTVTALSSNSITTSKNAIATETVTLVVENIPSLGLT